MNRTYFGNTQDLFKLDLVCHIMKNLPMLDSFTFVPMLTGNDVNAGDRKRIKKDLGKAVKSGKAGSKNRDLVAHMVRLQEIDDDLEYFRGIRSLFNKEKIMIDTFDENRFSHKHRQQYFKYVFETFPKRSLIFLDPDIGLEVKNPTQRHLLFDDVKKIHDRIDNHSIIMIYQHIPRVIHKGYIRHRCSQLAKLTGTSPVSITDNEIVFLLITKNPELKTKLEAILGKYANTYPVLSAPGCT